MSEAVLVPPGAGEIVGDTANRRVEILSDHESLHATWSRFGPRSEGADLHVHHHHTDLFYVLEGELTVRLGLEDEAVAVPERTLARVPPLVVHGFRNASDAQVRYLNFHAPGQGFADFLRARRDGRSFSYDQHPPPAEGGRPTSDAVVGGADVLVDGADLRLMLLADVDAIGVAEVSSHPDAEPPPAHVHRHVESVYVLEGELTLTAAGRESRVDAGAWIQVPPGVPRTFAVTGAGSARFLDVHTPSGGFGAFLRGYTG